MRPKLTYANVTATLALIIAVGGASAFAATQLAKNSVGTKQLKKNAVTTAKIKKEAVTGAKVKKGTLTGTQINASTLGTVPVAESAKSAALASSLAPAEGWHEVGAPGEPTFATGWKNVAGPSPSVAFYKDQSGIVHLRGAATAPSGAEQIIFRLPPGFRPTAGKDYPFIVACLCLGTVSVRVDVVGTDYASAPTWSGGILTGPKEGVDLGDISFRAES
jgi:hypothetical protein